MATSTRGTWGFGSTIPRARRWIAKRHQAMRRPSAPGFVDDTLQAGPDLAVTRQNPGVVPLERDRDLGLQFIRDRVDRRRGAEADGSGDAEDIKRQPWYHTIELPGGVVTEGVYDHRVLVAHYGIPESLEGKKVLDVATADGFWAFEFEKRGATVTALDIASTDQVDLPRAVRDRARAEGLVDSLGDGFTLAHRLRGSQVRKVVGSVYDLENIGTFDLVHAGDLLIHLRDPLAALQQIAAVTRGQALLSDVFDPDLGFGDASRGLTRYLGGWLTAGWWLPSLPTLVQMIADAGFSTVEIVNLYRLDIQGNTGPWRAVMRARP